MNNKNAVKMFILALRSFPWNPKITYRVRITKPRAKKDEFMEVSQTEGIAAFFAGRYVLDQYGNHMKFESEFVYNFGNRDEWGKMGEMGK